MQKILIVAHDFPFPPKHGGRVDMWSRIKLLKSLGFHVDLIASVKDAPGEAEANKVRGYVRNLLIVEREMGIMSHISREPFSVRSRHNLERVPLAESYAAVILETEHVAPILQNATLQVGQRILRLQNDEAQYYRELSTASLELWRKFFYRLEGARFRFFSPGVIRRCDSLWFISDFERQEYCVENPQSASKAFFVPPHVASSALTRHALTSNRVLFSGRLGFATNTRGLEWYIRQVHPRLADIAQYQLVVAGSTGGEPLDSLRKAMAPHPNISLHEDPLEIEPYYERAAVFVNPVFQGAGLKLKTIDAIQAGLPVVSTSIGIQGTGLLNDKHILVADSPQAFADCIRRLLKDRSYAESMVAEAQAFVAREYDQRTVIRRAFCCDAEASGAMFLSKDRHQQSIISQPVHEPGSSQP
jgi:glycosyltransferase involved in cell wall biosynthesis